MQRKVFKLFEDLCGDVEKIIEGDNVSLYITAALNSIEAASNVLEFIFMRSNNKILIAYLQDEVIEQVKTYKQKNQIKLQELKADFEKNKSLFETQNAEYGVAKDVIKKVAEQLSQTIDFVKKKKEYLSKTSELINENNVELSMLDEWLRTSIRNYNKLIKIYQGG